MYRFAGAGSVNSGFTFQADLDTGNRLILVRHCSEHQMPCLEPLMLPAPGTIGHGPYFVAAPPVANGGGHRLPVSMRWLTGMPVAIR